MACCLCGQTGGHDIGGYSVPNCGLARDAPCCPCLRLQELEEKIGETKLLLTHLINQRHVLKTDINHAHDLITNRLPPEITSRIFMFCLRGDNNLPLKMSAPLLPGAVCKTWRRIAWSTPRLWTSVYIHLSLQGLHLQAEILIGWFGRSGRLPLSIYVNCQLPEHPSPFRPVMDIVNQYSTRWQDMELRIPASLVSYLRGDAQGVSILRSLKIHSDCHDRFAESIEFSMPDMVSSPQMVEISGLAFRLIDINWSNVSHVRIDELHVHECLQLFEQAPRISYCKIECIYRDTGDSIHIPKNHITLLYLETLEIGFGTTAPEPLFSKLSFPSLKRLIYDVRDEYPFSLLESLLIRSSCPLVYFSIDDYSIDDDELIRLLRATPLLEDLKLIHTYVQNTFFDVLGTTAILPSDGDGDVFLPRLKSLSYLLHEALGHEDIRWASFAAIFSSGPQMETREQRPLTEVDIQFFPYSLTNTIYDEDPSYIDEDVLPRLLEIIDDGIDLTITDRYESDFIEASQKFYDERRREDSGGRGE